LYNSPAIFQGFVNTAFRDLVKQKIVICTTLIYINNLIVLSRNKNDKRKNCEILMIARIGLTMMIIEDTSESENEKEEKRSDHLVKTVKCRIFNSRYLEIQISKVGYLNC